MKIRNKSENEFDSYLEEENEKINYILFYWKSKSSIFPNLGKLVRKYLCCCATSVKSESGFSNMSLITTKLRNRITPEHTQWLLFLNSNRDLWK